MDVPQIVASWSAARRQEKENLFPLLHALDDAVRLYGPDETVDKLKSWVKEHPERPIDF
jgi:hypothetical protein